MEFNYRNILTKKFILILLIIFFKKKVINQYFTISAELVNITRFFPIYLKRLIYNEITNNTNEVQLII